MKRIDQAQAARTLAGVIVSDLALYAGAKLRRAVADDAVYDRFAEEFAEARRFYLARVSSALDPLGHFVDVAFCDLVLRHNGHIPSRMW